MAIAEDPNSSQVTEVREDAPSQATLAIRRGTQASVSEALPQPSAQAEPRRRRRWR